MEGLSLGGVPQHKEAKKRKKPPTYQHLPIQRAKKLKQTWVEEKKIKKSYRTEKRRMGYGTGANKGTSDSGWPSVTHQHGEGQVDRQDLTLTGLQEDPTDLKTGGEGPDTSAIPARNTEHREPGRSRAYPSSKFTKGRPKSSDTVHSTTPRTNAPPEMTTPSKVGKKRKAAGDEREVNISKDPAPSFREVKREAYSRQSLHTFKSNPLRRKRDGGGSNVSSLRNDTAHGRGVVRRGGASQRSGRAGQPDMRLRMASMLEEIKRSM